VAGKLTVISAQNEYSDNLTILALARICKGDFNSGIFSEKIAQRVMCNLLDIRYDSAKDYFGKFRDLRGYASIPNDKLLSDVLTTLDRQTLGRFLLYMHYQGPGIYGWEKLSPLQVSNLSVKSIKEVGLNIISHDSQKWSLQRGVLILRKFLDNEQWLIKLCITNNSALPISVLQLLTPYLLLLKDEGDYYMLCEYKIFNREILQWEDISTIGLFPIHMEYTVAQSLVSISNLIKDHDEKHEYLKARWVYFATFLVAALTAISCVASIWAAYQTQRQADAAWAALPTLTQP
jgi:hypothetical protein